MGELAEYIDGLPSICGSEQRIEEAIRARGADPVFLPPGTTGFADVNSAYAIALHMHQPLIPAGGPDLRTLLCCAHTSVYTLRVKVPGNPHPWYKLRGR